ncbi:DUF3795 domain-containing protein [Iocasia frigidifontis]|nr:DUF3795 domain-containing protein [Iocasia fonsfrigidae]
MKRLDTYCGLYCGSCEIFLVNQRDLVEETAKKWKTNSEDLYCNGCKKDTNSVFCKDCQIKLCSESKELDYCFQCEDFPCADLIKFKNDENPHHSIVLHNLNNIKKIGTKKWLKEQEKRWSCPECGEKYSWYDEKCSNCNRYVKSCIDDEKEIKLKYLWSE